MRNKNYIIFIFSFIITIIFILLLFFIKIDKYSSGVLFNNESSTYIKIDKNIYNSMKNLKNLSLSINNKIKKYNINTIYKEVDNYYCALSEYLSEYENKIIIVKIKINETNILFN